LKVSDVMSQRKWPLLGKYLDARNAPLTEHQTFLKTLTLGYWREYSEYSHATFQGLMRVGVVYAQADVPHDHRGKMEEASLGLIFGHMARASVILLCILTELQANCHFNGARINERLHEVWNALVGAPEVKDLYDGRYAQLMRDKKIEP
jgi:hypothetical protein